MRTLQEIKDEYAGEQGRDSWFEFFQYHELTHTPLDRMQYHHDEVAKRFAKEVSEYNKYIMKAGIELIAKERQEQLEKHGLTVDSDVNINTNGALLSVVKYLIDPLHSKWPKHWNVDYKEHLDNNKTKLEKLVIAGALIAAEIDRLQFSNENNIPKL